MRPIGRDDIAELLREIQIESQLDAMFETGRHELTLTTNERPDSYREDALIRADGRKLTYEQAVYLAILSCTDGQTDYLATLLNPENPSIRFSTTRDKRQFRHIGLDTIMHAVQQCQTTEDVDIDALTDELVEPEYQTA